MTGFYVRNPCLYRECQGLDEYYNDVQLYDIYGDKRQNNTTQQREVTLHTDPAGAMSVLMTGDNDTIFGGSGPINATLAGAGDMIGSGTGATTPPNAVSAVGVG
jgi:hypothetical protein